MKSVIAKPSQTIEEQLQPFYAMRLHTRIIIFRLDSWVVFIGILSPTGSAVERHFCVPCDRLAGFRAPQICSAKTWDTRLLVDFKRESSLAYKRPGLVLLRHKSTKRPYRLEKCLAEVGVLRFRFPRLPWTDPRRTDQQPRPACPPCLPPDAPEDRTVRQRDHPCYSQPAGYHPGDLPVILMKDGRFVQNGRKDVC